MRDALRKLDTEWAIAKHEWNSYMKLDGSRGI